MLDLDPGALPEVRTHSRGWLSWTTSLDVSGSLRVAGARPEGGVPEGRRRRRLASRTSGAAPGVGFSGLHTRRRRYAPSVAAEGAAALDDADLEALRILAGCCASAPMSTPRGCRWRPGLRGQRSRSRRAATSARRSCSARPPAAISSAACERCLPRSRARDQAHRGGPGGRDRDERGGDAEAPGQGDAPRALEVRRQRRGGARRDGAARDRGGAGALGSAAVHEGLREGLAAGARLTPRRPGSPGPWVACPRRDGSESMSLRMASMSC